MVKWQTRKLEVLVPQGVEVQVLSSAPCFPLPSITLPLMIFEFKSGSWDISSGAKVFGILNVTPDSFYDGGEVSTVEEALRKAGKMIQAGADAIDIGGESTRPGSPGISLAEEMRRVIPVIQALHKEFDTVISIDTTKPEVAEAALKNGAQIVNDISAGTDPRMIDVISKYRAGWILMHMQGTPRDMQISPAYSDVTGEILSFLLDRASAALTAGISPRHLAIDPGIGFGKTLGHNLEILAHTAQFARTGYPVMIGTSRKSFLGMISGAKTPDTRLPGSLASALWAYHQGARFLRVHDVAETVDALKTWSRIGGIS